MLFYCPFGELSISVYSLGIKRLCVLLRRLVGTLFSLMNLVLLFLLKLFLIYFLSLLFFLLLRLYGDLCRNDFRRVNDSLTATSAG